MAKKYRPDNPKTKQLEEEFNDYGYNIKGVRRSHKKKVTKFKKQTYQEDFYDTWYHDHVDQTPTSSQTVHYFT